MDPRRVRRPGPLFRRRPAISTALLLAAALGALAAFKSAAPLAHPLARALPVPTSAARSTPEDDVSTPTPRPSPELAAQRPSQGPQGPSVSVPILLYHYVRNNPVATDQVGFELSVTPQNFALQMGFLRAVGVHTISLADVSRALATGRPLPPRSVVLTFDDGYTNFATVAAPVMQHDGLMGTVYVVSGFIGRNGYMNATQVREVQDMGMVVGCHTVSHVDLSHVPLDYARTQIDVAHQQLVALLGRPVPDFAYPYGGVNADVEKLVQADGFRDAVTTQWGDTELQSQPMAWPRMRIGGHDTVYTFAEKALAGLPAAQVDAMVRAYLASPAAGSSAGALPTPAHALAMGDPRGDEARRLV